MPFGATDHGCLHDLHDIMRCKAKTLQVDWSSAPQNVISDFGLPPKTNGMRFTFAFGGANRLVLHLIVTATPFLLVKI